MPIAAADDPTVQAALTARLIKRCKGVAVVFSPPGAPIEIGTTLTQVQHGLLTLGPILDGTRLHEFSSRSPVMAGGGYVVFELAPVHPSDCEALTGGACDCGAQELFEGLVLSGA